jgi:hypothetical protein
MARARWNAPVRGGNVTGVVPGARRPSAEGTLLRSRRAIAELQSVGPVGGWRVAAMCSISRYWVGTPLSASRLQSAGRRSRVPLSVPEELRDEGGAGSASAGAVSRKCVTKALVPRDRATCRYDSTVLTAGPLATRPRSCRTAWIAATVTSIADTRASIPTSKLESQRKCRRAARYSGRRALDCVRFDDV